MESHEIACPECGHEFTPIHSRIEAIESDEHGLVVRAYIVAGIDDTGVVDSFRLDPNEWVEKTVKRQGREDVVRRVQQPKQWTPELIRAEVRRRAEERAQSRAPRREAPISEELARLIGEAL